MNLAKVWTFARYEIRRATARKKVLALVVLTLLIGTIPAYLLRSSSGISSLLPPYDYPYIWVIGIFLPQGFFLPFTALLISAGSMSEEYEQGTAEVLLAKPVARDEFFFGKFLGGFVLLAMVVVLNAILGVSSATIEFGTQFETQIMPLVVVTQIFASLVFYSVAFMSGELVRRSSLSYIIAAAVYFTSSISGVILRFIFQLTGNAFYQQVDLYLPTSAVSALPLLVGQPSIPSDFQSVFRLLSIGTDQTSIPISILLILIYATVAIAVARSYFNWADVAKRVA